MLIPLHNLLDRLHQPRRRARELSSVRRELVNARKAKDVSGLERDLAERLGELRVQVSAALSETTSCAGCSAGMARPEGTFSGGHCCSSHTADLFNDAEVAAIALSGSRPGDMRAPPGEQAGCAFRGEKGCTLKAVHRPTVCARYMCRTLRDELHERGTLLSTLAIVDEMDEIFGAFIAERARRLRREELAAIDLRLLDEPAPT